MWQIRDHPARRLAGLRLLSADGLPMAGATGLPDVYVNTGRGDLGWTRSSGSGDVLADQPCGLVFAVDLDSYSPLQF